MFDKIARYFYGINGSKYLKEKVINEMNNNFKELFNKATGRIKSKIL